MTRRPAPAGCRARGLLVSGGVLLATGAVLLAAPGAALGQGSVHAASLDADLTAAGGMARVRVEYELDGVAPGALVPVSVLDFGAARAQGFRVGTAGAPATLSRTHGAARSGAWPVEAGADGRSVLRVEYGVPGTEADEGGRIVSHVPVLVVGLVPEAARPGLFQGRVRAPVAWAVTEGFPTGLARGGQAGLFDVALAVVPAVVTLRARVGGRSPPALPLVLDLVALAVLCFTAVAGWRHMREPVA
ncbi:MAG TPA: hypothetical protein VJ997_04500 [Longimicrobiales bacterium]|nr:hypothetical protein [Longimicrobiales bacterium]